MTGELIVPASLASMSVVIALEKHLSTCSTLQVENHTDEYYRVLCEDRHPFPTWSLHLRFLDKMSGQP
jgi:hypothetical protein